jgi:cyclophilin family peptidyl-prolyl cis-trans isomerase
MLARSFDRLRRLIWQCRAIVDYSAAPNRCVLATLEVAGDSPPWIQGLGAMKKLLPAAAAALLTMLLVVPATVLAVEARPVVLLHTTKGDVIIELYEDEAPNTVANFVSLVEKGFYNGLKFHRVIDGFMAQGGDPKGNGSGGPGYSIACECYRSDAVKHARGSLSMAHAGKDTGGSQFFITFKATSFLNGKHTVFGQVVQGMDVVDKFQRMDPEKPNPYAEPDRIIEARMLRKRNHPYVVAKIEQPDRYR